MGANGGECRPEEQNAMGANGGEWGRMQEAGENFLWARRAHGAAEGGRDLEKFGVGKFFFSLFSKYHFEGQNFLTNLFFF